MRKARHKLSEMTKARGPRRRRARETKKKGKGEKKKGEKIRQIEVNQDLDYKNNPLETYKRYLENVIPSNFSVDIVGNHIEIKEN